MLLIGFSGALKALELENQVLKLRNAQLELAGNTETLKGWFDVFAVKCVFESVNSNASLMKSKCMIVCNYIALSLFVQPNNSHKYSR
jgi:hypothetical protein